MLIGPLFTREVITVPRRARLYVARTTYVGGLMVLMCTAWLLLAGTQIVRNVGDYSRFGYTVFQLFAFLQLALALFFAAFLASGAVSQEKDRRTLVLLLLTRLNNAELIFGRLFASLLLVYTLLLAALPLFMIVSMFGGISFPQIARMFVINAVAVFVAGSLGSTIAHWREKTFQALALTAILLVAWLGAGELLNSGLVERWLPLPGTVLAECLSPWRAMLAATRSSSESVRSLAGLPWPPYQIHLVFGFACAILLNAIAISRVRSWNTRGRDSSPERGSTRNESAVNGNSPPIAGDTGSGADAADTRPAAMTSVHAAPGKIRAVWNNPILWREIRTWAYGRRILIVRAGYLLLGALIAWSLQTILSGNASATREQLALPLVPLYLVSLVLINALAVTSLTTERDGRSLDLLLVTDLTPKEFIFGKLAGVFYNTKEMVLVPVLFCVYLWYSGVASGETAAYLFGGLLVMMFFVAMLGLHVGMAYVNSRNAISVSLGIVFFLFVGVATCMRIMIAFSGSFNWQLQPFLALILGGFVGLYVALGIRNPSPAIMLASLICPFATFYAITSFFLNFTLGVFLVTAATYGFASAAMLVPALYEFDVATGRANTEDE